MPRAGGELATDSSTDIAIALELALSLGADSDSPLRTELSDNEASPTTKLHGRRCAARPPIEA